MVFIRVCTFSLGFPSFFYFVRRVTGSIVLVNSSRRNKRGSGPPPGPSGPPPGPPGPPPGPPEAYKKATRKLQKNTKIHQNLQKSKNP